MPSRRHRLYAALLLGGATGLRSLTGVATLAAQGALTASRTRRDLILLAATGELIADKLPQVPSRLAPLPYLGRVMAGALCGRRAGGRLAVLPGAAAAAVTTRLGYQARSAATARGLPDLGVALFEDAIALSAARFGAALVAGSSAMHADRTTGGRP